MNRPWYRPRMAKVVIAILAGACLSLLGRIVSIQSWEREQWLKKEVSPSGNTKTLRGFRGRILDRTGCTLAQTVLKVRIVASPQKIENWLRDERQTDREFSTGELRKAPEIRRIAKLIGLTLDINQREVLKKLTAPAAQYKKLASDVPVAIADDLLTALDELECHAVRRQLQTYRYYPYDRLASAVVGYCREPRNAEDNIEYGSREWPDGGVEKQFRNITVGETVVLGDRYDRWHRRILRPRMGQRPTANPGNDLVLTIHFSVQQAVERALDECRAHRHPAGANVTVLSVQTGEVLAMACRPTYDPNHIQKRPSNSSSSSKSNGLAHLTNRPVARAMAPGSTLKVLTIAAAIESGVIDTDSRYNCAGTEQIGGEPLRCWGKWAHRGHGTLRPAQVLAKSCNICAAKIALDVGPHRLCAFLKKCGIAQKPHAGFPDEAAGRLMKPERMRKRDTACLGFGQGVSCSDLQIAAAVSAIVNGGRFVHPHIVRGYIDPITGETHRVRPHTLRTVCSERTSRLMRQFLRGVVDHGTGKVAQIPNYAIGAKTATAQIFDRTTGHYMTGRRNHVMSFVLVAPVDRRPDFVIVVSVERPANGRYGSQVAGPVARRIAEFLLKKPEIFAPHQPLPTDSVMTARRRLAR